MIGGQPYAPGKVARPLESPNTYQFNNSLLPAPQSSDQIPPFCPAPQSIPGSSTTPMTMRYQIPLPHFDAVQRNAHLSRYSQFPLAYNPLHPTQQPTFNYMPSLNNKPAGAMQKQPPDKGGPGYDFDTEWAFCSSQGQPGAKKPPMSMAAPLTAMSHAAPSLEMTQPAPFSAPPAVAVKRKLDGVNEEVNEDDAGSKGKTPWRKYGQKALKGKNYTGMKMMRCYYRCNYPGCQVKKEVDSSSWLNDVVNVSVNGQHNHPVTADEKEPLPDQHKPNVKLELEAITPGPTPTIDAKFASRMVMRNFVVSDPLSPDCPIIFVSAGFEDLTGYSAGETVGRNCRFLQGKDTNTHAVLAVGKAIRERREVHVILLNYTKDKVPFWNFLHITPTLTEDGKLHSIVGTQLHVDGCGNDSGTFCIKTGEAPAGFSDIDTQLEKHSNGIDKEPSTDVMSPRSTKRRKQNKTAQPVQACEQFVQPVQPSAGVQVHEQEPDASRRHVAFSTQASTKL